MIASLEKALASPVWAVAGVSTDESKFGTKVFRYLKRAGKKVYGINPRLDAFEGEKIYASPADLPEVPGILSLVVPAKIGLGLAEQAAKAGIPIVWMQPGAESDDLIERSNALGLDAIYDKCVMVEMEMRGGPVH